MKRCFDIGFSILGLLLLFPFLLLLMAVTRFKLGSPVLFVQERVGLHDKTFELIKLRSMMNIYDGEKNLSSDADRLNSFGKWVRSSSLDELPELWNVLKGEMSLVGPRPLLPEYLPLYTKYHRRRHEVLPGITGWAQINGRNNLSWKKKFSLDIWYVKNQSFKIDILIICKTILNVIKMENISQKGHVTMEKFSGNKNEKY